MPTRLRRIAQVTRQSQPLENCLLQTSVSVGTASPTAAARLRRSSSVLTPMVGDGLNRATREPA